MVFILRLEFTRLTILWVSFFIVSSKEIVDLVNTDFDNLVFDTLNWPKPFVRNTECGGVVKGPNGEISYKVDEQLTSNETCVWALRSVNSTDYSIGIFSLGFANPSNEAKLTFSCPAFANLTHTVMSEPGLYNANNCTVVFLTLITGNVENSSVTGFSLQYVGLSLGGIRSSAEASVDLVMDNGQGYLHHPSVGVPSLYELSSFLFLPSKGDDSVNVVYVLDELPEYRTNNLTVYSLQRDSTEPWKQEAEISYSTKAMALKSKDGLLVIFRNTDRGTNNKGFQFITKCPKEVVIPDTSVLDDV